MHILYLLVGILKFIITYLHFIMGQRETSKEMTYGLLLIGKPPNETEGLTGTFPFPISR